LSEFTILNGAIGNGAFVIAGLFLLLLVTVFIGMGSTVLSLVQGAPSQRASATNFRDTILTGAPILVLMGLVLMLGVYIPPPLDRLLHDAVNFLETPP